MFSRVLVVFLLVGAIAGDGAAETKRGSEPDSPVIRFLEERITGDPLDILALNRLSGEYLARFRISGDDDDLDRAARCAEQSLKAVPADLNKGGLAARARASFALHRFAAARDDARRLVQMEPGKRYPLEILGDALLELGDYAEAADVYAKMEAFEAAEPDATTEIRMARLALAKGDRAEAARRFVAAVELARENAESRPEVLAWALVQAGQFDFSSGRWEQAEVSYSEALRIKPDDWPALDHLAELRAAQGRFEESVSIYLKLVERVPRPELFQALGDVYREMKSPDAARPWHDRAAAAYKQAVAKGSSHYFHHLAGFYCDVDSNSDEAVRLAREDLKVRHTAPAYDALAWSLYHAGQFADAAAAMDQALRSGFADGHVLYHAALIYARADRAKDAQDSMRKTAEVNPKFMSFHVHR
jgi:tetratricopeptide (TPR) repeat protein